MFLVIGTRLGLSVILGFVGRIIYLFIKIVFLTCGLIIMLLVGLIRYLWEYLILFKKKWVGLFQFGIRAITVLGCVEKLIDELFS